MKVYARPHVTHYNANRAAGMERDASETHLRAFLFCKRSVPVWAPQVAITFEGRDH